MRRYCKYCKKHYLTHSGTDWRYRAARACPDCKRVGPRDESSERQRQSRNAEVKRRLVEATDDH